MSTALSSASAIPSVQQIADGVPRFRVPLSSDDPAFATVSAAESAGGVEAEVRAFLDAQLGTGDVLLDINPGFGFVALNATTAPNGMPTVFVAGLPIDRMQQLQDVAADAGGWLESIDVTDAAALMATIDSRLEPEGRVFVHAVAANAPWICQALHTLIETGRVLAICVSDAFEAERWPDAEAALSSAGFTACMVVEQNDEAVMVPCAGHPTAPVIALPTSLVLTEPTHVDEAPPAPDAIDAPGATDHAHDTSAMSAAIPAAIPDTIPATIPAQWTSRWNATRDGFALIAPHSRTGYGVTGAHLLKALQQRGIPMTFFPIGPLDRTLTDNAQLIDAVRAQGAYRSDVPSVRLSQQFDLALHVGRGRHVAFTIFELDRFTVRERHHLMQQDAVLVCSNWAREVCLQNGIDDRPIHVVPLGVDREVFHEHVTPTTTWNDTVFMQVGKLESRKGQLELLRAFEAAFTPKDAVRLVLSCGNPFITRAELDAQLSPFRRSPMASRIVLMTNELASLRDVASLMAGADCGVFAVRAEGWNLEALEMLSMGKTIIATSATAHTEYMTRDNARLVTIDGFEPAQPHAGVRPDASGGRWASWGASQQEQLVSHLRDVHAAKQSGALAPNAAGIRTAQYYSWQHSADAMLRALDAIA
jgi:glycosyltransferase involved in cell wall biosynthesis